MSESKQGSSHNTIAFGTQIDGHIVAQSDIRIDGCVRGNVKSQGKVIIGVQGECHGDIEAESLDISGLVIGDVSVENGLSVFRTGRLTGNMTCHTILVEPEAILDGQCKMH